MFVKICGVTNESDALMATAMGTDAVGFVFAPSSRQVQPTAVRDIVRRLPPDVLTIGVFRNETPERIVEVVNVAGLRGAQLHGFESAAETAFVRDRVPLVIKAFAIGHPLLERIDDYEVDAVLLDGPEPGSGRVADWDVARHLAARHRVILAGGLRPDTVADAIATVAPWGVDVSSGVEAAPGRKDVRLTRRFIAIARSAAPLDTAHPMPEEPPGETAMLSPEEATFDPAPWTPPEPEAAAGVTVEDGDGGRVGFYDWEGEGPA